MPLYKTITVNPGTKVFIWKIEESYEKLCKGIALSENSKNRIACTKSNLHLRGFMSVRHLLAAAGYTDSDLFYDQAGKPHLTPCASGEKYISITHSFIFSAIIISDVKVGVDIEKQRDKILRIAHKFTPIEEYRTIANTDALIRKLTIVWGGKEAIYKLYSQPCVSFLQHIIITDFDFDDAETTGKVIFRNNTSWYKLEFLEIEGFTCVFALPNETRI